MIALETCHNYVASDIEGARLSLVTISSLVIAETMWLLMQQRLNALSNSCKVDMLFLCQLVLSS